jgi:hypothetical protein
MGTCGSVDVSLRDTWVLGTLGGEQCRPQRVPFPGFLNVAVLSCRFLGGLENCRPQGLLYPSVLQLTVNKSNQSKSLSKGLVHLLSMIDRSLKTSGQVCMQWERMPKQGMAPSVRSSFGMVLHKNKAIMFGGAADEEAKKGEVLVSSFFNDLYQLNLLQGRWYPVALRLVQTQKAKGELKPSSD